MEKVKNLYHGTNTLFDKFDLSKSGGLVNFAEDPSIAKQYAMDVGGSGGRKTLKNNEIDIINVDTNEIFKYDQDKKLWVNDKGIGLSKQDFADLMDEGNDYFEAVPKNSRIIQVTSPTSKILDTYPDKSQPYYKQANKKGLEAFLDIVEPSKIENTINPEFTPISQRYIQKLKNQAIAEIANQPGAPGFGHTFWGTSKLSRSDEIGEALKGMKSQLQNAGYEGLRFQDEYYPTTALFNPSINKSSPLNTSSKYVSKIQNFINNSKSGKVFSTIAPLVKPVTTGIGIAGALMAPDMAEAAADIVIPGGIGTLGVSDEQKELDKKYSQKLREMSQRNKK